MFKGQVINSTYKYFRVIESVESHVIETWRATKIFA